MSMAYEVHMGSWTVDDVLTLPETGSRYEIVDGALVMSPPPSRDHQRVSWRLHNLLFAAADRVNASVEILEG